MILELNHVERITLIAALEVYEWEQHDYLKSAKVSEAIPNLMTKLRATRV